MGIKIKELVDSEIITLDELKNKVVAIDGMNMLFQILYNPIQRQKKLDHTFYLDSSQRVISHLYGWLQKINHFYKNQILPVIVFDGKPDTFKRRTIKNYAHDFIEVEKLYKQALKQGDKDMAKAHALSRSYMFMNCVKESKILIESSGFPVIMAPSESEAQCASLQQQGLVDYVISTDYDSLLFGATHIIKKLTFQERKKIQGRWKVLKPEIEYISSEKIYQKLNISRKQLIDLAILVGTDYDKGIVGIGPHKALASIKYYGTIEKMIDKHPEKFTHLPLSKVKIIRQLFLDHEVIQLNNRNIRLKPFNEHRLRHLLLKDHTLNKEKIEPKLEKLKKLHTKFAKKLQINPQKIILQPENPFNIHIQRRLERAKVQVQPDFIPELCFTSADQLNKSNRPPNTKFLRRNRNSSQTHQSSGKIIKKIYLKKKRIED